MIICFEDEYGDYLKEINSIQAVPAWDTQKGESKDLPGLYSVAFDGEYVGRYCLDGTKETYKEAIINYQEVTALLCVNGYCEASKFENFEWY